MKTLAQITIATKRLHDAAAEYEAAERALLDLLGGVAR
jgi:uncharacterized membrane protein YhaH (DUF805 family)